MYMYIFIYFHFIAIEDAVTGASSTNWHAPASGKYLGTTAGHNSCYQCLDPSEDTGMHPIPLGKGGYSTAS